MAITFNGAIIAAHARELLLVVVRPWLLEDAYEAQLVQIACELRFHRPVVLMAQDARGAPRFLGQRELLRLLRGLPIAALPWRRFTVGD